MTFLLRNLFLLGLAAMSAVCVAPVRGAIAEPAAPVVTLRTGLVRMLSYNVRVETDETAWERRRETVMQVLTATDYDVIAIQEASELMIADYQAALPDHYYVVGERSDGHRGDQSWYEFNPIFFNPARFEKLDAGSIWVGEDPARPGDTLVGSKPHGRVFTWIVLRECATGRRLAVGNVHVHGAESSRAIDLLVETLRAHAGDAEMVLLGDFNSEPGSEAYTHLTGRDGYGFVDAMLTAADVSGDGVTTIGQGQAVPEGDAGFKTGSDARRIDFIFAEQGLGVEAYNVPDSAIRDGVFASDHMPLAVILELPDRSPPPPQPEGEIAEGVTYSRILREGERPLVAHIVTVDLTNPNYRFTVTPQDTSAGAEYTARLTSNYLETTGAALAFNGSYFLPFSGGSPGGDDYYPHVGDPVSVSGAAISGGETVSPVETDIDIRVNAMICFDALRIAIKDGQACPAGYSDGLAAGPHLLADGKTRDFAAFDNRYASTPAPRTAVGISADRKTAWIVAVDGRQQGYSLGADLNDLVAIFTSLGASDAINLDGGGSTTLVARSADGLPLVLNRPIHTGVPGRERPVANQIVLLPATQARQGD
nr:phosphodiester glycosidase family protein [uncultured Hyphomonas sp.]